MEGGICTGDCLKCNMQQQIYCAAQRSYAIMRNQEAIVERINAMDSKLAAFAPQQPMIRLTQNNAQNGPGAENRGPSL